ncbi:ribose/galactose ABC transporter permease [Entomoplasma ellychniae]|uniref:Ribose/galactose ABC transporter permease n=1 Tax=Entomoplasma ellychniae TaxID=2114 RepID=A0A8E2QY62_9MOLU|nr:ABC transporter permease [Entomoplasma ellychniae]PPE04434.1 ribose/galactose ABC transporter permease [Entomoplasma ellychniae]
MNNKLNVFAIKQKMYFKSSIFKEKVSKTKVTTLAILIGLLLSSLFVFAVGSNGFEFVLSSFIAPFKYTDNLKETLIWISTFTLLGLGMGLGFKIKLFNISGTGQAILGLIVAYTILYKIAGSNEGIKDISATYGFPIFLIFILTGAALSCLIGFLKIYLNIHEVASSIVLNWIIWYSFELYVNKFFGIGDISTSSPELLKPFGEYIWVFGLVLTAICVIGVTFVYNKTTIGYKYKVMGLQSDAAIYSGINVKKYLLFVTAIQGLLISCGAFMYIFGIKFQMGWKDTDFPTIGFDGLPIALIAFNNFLAMVPIATIWSFQKVGMKLLIDGGAFNTVPEATSGLVFGIIMYISALYVVFARFDLKDLYYKTKMKLMNPAVKLNNNHIKAESLKVKKQIKLLKTKLNVNANENLNIELDNLKKILIDLNSSKKDFKNSQYKKFSKNIKISIKDAQQSIYVEKTYKLLDEISLLDIDNNYKQTVKDLLEQYDIEKKDMFKKFKLQLKSYDREIKMLSKKSKFKIKKDNKKLWQKKEFYWFYSTISLNKKITFNKVIKVKLSRQQEKVIKYNRYLAIGGKYVRSVN